VKTTFNISRKIASADLFGNFLQVMCFIMNVLHCKTKTSYPNPSSITVSVFNYLPEFVLKQEFKPNMNKIA